MTEERFEQIIEHAADRLDKSMNRAWNHRPVRIVSRTISLVTGAGLIVSAAPLAENGHQMAAKICFISGVVVIAAEVLQIIIFRRK